MKIIWSNFASEMLTEIFFYYKEYASLRVANRIKTEIFDSTKALLKNTKIGQVELNLTLLNEGHRYLVVGNYKVIYKEVPEGVLITDVFHISQNPIKMGRGL